MNDYNEKDEYRSYEKDIEVNQMIIPESAEKRKRKENKKISSRIWTAVIALSVAAGSFGLGTGVGRHYQPDSLAVANVAETAGPEILQTKDNVAPYMTEEGTVSVPSQQELADIAKIAEAETQLKEKNYALMANTTKTEGFASVSDVFKAIDDSVVSINMTVKERYYNMISESKGAGSGIIFREDSDKIYIVTNYHVIDSASAVTISLDDVNEATAKYVGGDERSDIAIISVDKKDLEEAGITNYKVASFGDSDKMEIGDMVVAVGNAIGEGKSATMGIVSAKNKQIKVDSGATLTVMQTDAAINPGNSGGALVNSNAQVIGINTAKLTDTQVEGMGYAIPSNVVIKIAGQIMEKGTVKTPYMGISIVTVTDQIKSYYGFADNGVYLNNVAQHATAYEMGARVGDIITSYNGTRVTEAAELSKMIAETEVGSEVVIEVLRSNRTVTLRGEMLAYEDNTSF